MILSDLHELVEAAVRYRLSIARAATPGPWLHVDAAGGADSEVTYMGCGSVITLHPDLVGGDVASPNGDLYSRSGYSPMEDMAHIALNDPAQVILDCVEDLGILERHRPRKHDDWLQAEFGAHDWCGACRGSNSYPCFEVLSLGRRYRIHHDPV